MKVLLLVLAFVATNAVELDVERAELMNLLVKEMNDLREELAHIEAQIQTSQVQYAEEISDIKHQIAEARRDVAKRNSEVALVENRCNAMPEMPEFRPYLWCAFAAYASSVREYTAGDNIVFDGVFFEEPQGSYNPIIGLFTCFETGYFFIYGQFYNVYNEAMSFQIRYGTTVLTTVQMTQTRYSAAYTVSTHCLQGASILVRAFSGSFRLGPDSAYFSAHLVAAGPA